jgi:1-acyl-sn-glycerol-3-phosphate acyltransferase
MMHAETLKLDFSSIFHAELPYLAQRPSTRILLRAMLGASLRLIRGVYDAGPLLSTPAPFILTVNHTQYAEALLIPALLMYLRGGNPIRFLADWNFLLIPGVRSLMRMAETIPVTTKPARPHWLNRFRQILVQGPAGMDGSRLSIAQGRSIGIFPEGRAHGDTRCTLPGRRGAAVLALQTGVPVFPAGIRFPCNVQGRPLPVLVPLELHIGEPIHPGRPTITPHVEQVEDFHRIIMTAIARLAGKTGPKPLTGGPLWRSQSFQCDGSQQNRTGS